MLRINNLVGKSAPVRVDPRALIDDPHAGLAALRREHPLVQLAEGQYLVLRADDVIPLLSDPRTRQVEGTEYVALNQIPDGITARFLKDFFIFSDSEQHRAKRGLFARSFAYKAMFGLRPDVRAVAERIVAELPRGEMFDFVERMAARVPAEMIAAILGLPKEDSAFFARRVYTIARAIGPIYPYEHHRAIENATGELFCYVAEQIRLRLDRPRDDLLSHLAASWRRDPVMPLESLIFQVIGVIIGGSDTTRAAFAMLVALLVQHRAWEAVRADNSLIPGAVAEAMRFDPSVGSVLRVATAPIEIGNVTVFPGTALRLSTMSALRDPGLYAEPERFDIRRADHPRLHPVFGLGPHRCIGETLARIEMEECLAALAANVREVEIRKLPRLSGFGGIREITPMPVRLH
ncbi:cytochrome P450 [Ancylobacter sp. MQZ15Z-1]|uniref:Cytochrome P450 n=1 Tax=Ancylobacter mangrovi TaxID=2972472 RepID=A0A9X2T5H1_9HYPH|nr:cytochrome P450 [Ancylobacter mangrovi]MCS0497271.1 cytochrome P450 [Ancylobacter mangrovi]